MGVRALLLCISLLSVCLGDLKASAFSIIELGTRSVGMGGAFVAVADDGSALFFNPAGIAFQKGMRFQMDMFAVHGVFRFVPSSVPRGTVVPEDGYNGAFSPNWQMIGNMYFSKDLTPKLTFGFGMFAPFGLGDNWTSFNDSDPPTTKPPNRYAGTRGRMESIWFQPTIAYRLHENTSIGVGFAIVHTHLLLEQSILNPLDDGLIFGQQLASTLFPDQDPTAAGKAIARMLPEGRARFAGTDQSPAFNVGILHRIPRAKTTVGASYRSQVSFHLDGHASFAFTDDYPLKPFVGEDTIPDLFPTQKITASFATPETISFGVSNSSLWNTTIAASFQYQDYRRFKDVALNFTQTEGTATPPELRLNFGFQHLYTVNVGFERPVTNSLIVRAGYYFDHSPVPERSVGPLFPDGNRSNWAVGASKQWGNKELSVFYEITKFHHLVVDVPENAKLWTNGQYNNTGHVLGFGMRFNLGGTELHMSR
jgi:long-chain fatty acid transport protein